MSTSKNEELLEDYFTELFDLYLADGYPIVMAQHMAWDGARERLMEEINGGK